MLGLLAGLLAFGAVVLGGWATSGWLRSREETRAALARRLESVVGLGDATAGRELLRDERLSSVEWLDAALARLPLIKPFVKAVRQAGLERNMTTVILAPVVVAASVAFLVAASDVGAAPALLVGAVAGAGPILAVYHRRRARAVRFGEQLPDALDLTRAALQAGHSLQNAFAVVAEEFPDPVAAEFRHVAEEVRLGLPLRDALHNLCARVDNADLPILTVGLLVTQEAGGNLVEVLDNVSHTIRERFKLQRDAQVLTAQGRMSGNVLTALPLAVGLGMYLLNPLYFRPMLEEPRGRAMLVYGAVSLVVGQLLMRRLTRVRV
ncbi:MAG: type II secretion system F family protein [Candidatus Binatia bacterium]